MMEGLLEAVQLGSCHGLRLSSGGTYVWTRAVKQETNAFEFRARFGWADPTGRRCGLVPPTYGLLDVSMRGGDLCKPTPRGLGPLYVW